MIESPSARTASVTIEIAAMLSAPSTFTFSGRSPTSPTVPVAANVPTEPPRVNASIDATPLRTEMVDGVFCSSVSPLKPSCRSLKVILPSASPMSGRRDDRSASNEMRPLSPAGAPGIALGSSPSRRA